MIESSGTKNPKKNKPFGLAAMFLGVIAVCTCWIPHVGWLSLCLALVGNALGVPAITRHYRSNTRTTSYGISGITMSTLALVVGLAVQVKHAGGRLDGLTWSISAGGGYGVLAASIALLVVGLIIARARAVRVGTLLAAVALVAIVFTGSSVLTNADRALVSDQATP
jgi:drug/metabolite transporter (DMT)-like permease